MIFFCYQYAPMFFEDEFRASSKFYNTFACDIVLFVLWPIRLTSVCEK